MLKRAFAFSFLFLLIANLVSANPPSEAIKVSGIVRSELSETPIADVNILVAGTELGTISDHLGKFSLQVDSLPVELIFRHIGYEEQRVVFNQKQVRIVQLRPVVLRSAEVLVVGTKAIPGRTPVAFTDLERSKIEQAYFHQDVPMVLADLPGVYAYSDAGNGIGYSYLSIRGFRQTQLGVFLNGVPLNDPEEHAVYWVDHGDLLASSSQIQVQRGVGNSLYGTSVFGGTVNVVTNPNDLPQGGSLNIGYGNYFEKGLDLPSNKLALFYNRRLHPNWSLMLRLSQLSSDGYRDGSGTSQQAGHFCLEHNKADQVTRIEALIGNERTYFAWEGIAPSYGFDLQDRRQRRYNFYADSTYNGGLTDANKDVFLQKILSVQHSRLFAKLLINLTFYAVQGSGYYEQFKDKRKVAEYNLVDIVPDLINRVDLIRQKWLKNGYGGFVYQANVPLNKIKISFGGDLRYYTGLHYGHVKQVRSYYLPDGERFKVRLAPAANSRYYQTTRDKISISTYIHTYTELTPDLGVMCDLRYLGHRYSYNQRKIGVYQNNYDFKLKYDFFDPHFGVNYRLTDQATLFANLSTGHREPTDDDIYKQDDPNDVPKLTALDDEYAHSLVKPEFLIDYEMGFKWSEAQRELQVNLYRMDFKNELIPVEYRYYDADQVYHANIPRTIHQGIEVAFQRRWRAVNWSTNLTYADNHFVEFRGDSIGWSGWGGIANYNGKQIPNYPTLQFKNLLTWTVKNWTIWWQTIHCGRQYIDFANTSNAAIKPWTVNNVGLECRFPHYRRIQAKLSFRINNLFDRLYETFGYNYYEEYDGTISRVDLYWPAATRNYYLQLTINF
jgi:iron complex outermembrane receptor protein